MNLHDPQRSAALGIERVRSGARQLPAPFVRLDQHVAGGQPAGRHPAARDTLRVEAGHLSSEPRLAALLDVLAQGVCEPGDQSEREQAPADVAGSRAAREDQLQWNGRHDSADQRTGDARPELEAFVELLALPVEEEDLVEVLLESRCAPEVALERLRRSRVRPQQAARPAIGHLLAEHLGDAGGQPFERSPDGRGCGGRARVAREPIGFGEHVEQPHADELIDQRPLLDDQRRILRTHPGQLVSRLADCAQRCFQPDREERLPAQVWQRLRGGCRAAVPSKSLLCAVEHSRERDRSATQLIDGEVAGAGDRRRPIEPRENL